jgi:hypothetical protein
MLSGQRGLGEISNDNILEVLSLKNNLDMLTIKAKKFHARYDYHSAYEVCVKYNSKPF